MSADSVIYVKNCIDCPFYAEAWGTSYCEVTEDDIEPPDKGVPEGCPIIDVNVSVRYVG